MNRNKCQECALLWPMKDRCCVFTAPANIPFVSPCPHLSCSTMADTMRATASMSPRNELEPAGHAISSTMPDSLSTYHHRYHRYALFMTMVMIAGLLIPFAQMYEMASRYTKVPFANISDPKQQCAAFSICLEIAKQAGVRWVPIDYPAGSKRAYIILPLYQRDDTEPLRMRKWAASKGVAKTRDWLKDQGMSSTDVLPFVAAKDPFYW
ncbi:hypothetical protein BD779DRAFT_1787274 [Infundibulicybe gibba]|nr:hypothetical protein BD779DRAFT_1787274 [Infundibulicybe gibba]